MILWYYKWINYGHSHYTKVFLLFSDVPILHLIPVPFPDEWHTMKDNADAIHYPTVEKLNVILRIFVAEYMELDWKFWEGLVEISESSNNAKHGEL